MIVHFKNMCINLRNIVFFSALNDKEILFISPTNEQFVFLFEAKDERDEAFIKIILSAKDNESILILNKSQKEIRNEKI